MKQKNSIITRKIEIVPLGEKEEIVRVWNYVRLLQNQVFKAANTVVNHQYFNELFRDRILKANEDIEKKSDARKEAQKYYGTSEQNTTYRILRESFPDLPSSITASLNNQIKKYFDKEVWEVKTGQRSLRTYKKGLPIPFMKSSLNFTREQNFINFKWFNKTFFGLKFGRDKSNNREIINRIIEGVYDYGDSSIQIKDRKMFLLLSVKIPRQKHKLNNDLCVGVDLGVNVPASCALSKGLCRTTIGSRETFLNERLKIQAQRKNRQKILKFAKGGKGRTKKLKGLEKIKQKERNFTTTYNHKISKAVVDFALRNKAAVIKLEFLEGYGENETNSFILRNWSYYQLQNFIQYKAQKHNIKTVFIDPYETSKRCHCCGEIGERPKQDSFYCVNSECKQYKERQFADYNAAVNIARSTKIVTKKEECQYHILQAEKRKKAKEKNKKLALS